MGKISSQFIVTALEDGLTIHGSLTSNRSLTQTVGSTVTPDWTNPSNQPTITLRVMKGSAYVAAQNYDWYLNGVKIDSDNPWNSWFVKGTVDIGGVACPTLKIVKNLGGQGNLDLDLITISGKIESNGALIDFSAGIEVKISRLTGNGYIPTIWFPEWYLDSAGTRVNTAGITQCVFTVKGQYLCAYAKLETENGPVSSYSCRWFLNYDDEVTATSAPAGGGSYKGTVTIDGTAYPCLYIHEGDVEDMTVVRCEYSKDGEVVAVQTEQVDDQQDPDMMYVTYGGSGAAYNGTPASLKTGQSVTFVIWVGTADTPEHEATMKSYNYYKVKLLNASAQVVTSQVLGSADVDADGWKKYDVHAQATAAGHKISITVTYAQTTAADIGKGKITGFIQASKTDF